MLCCPMGHGIDEPPGRQGELRRLFITTTPARVVPGRVSKSSASGSWRDGQPFLHPRSDGPSSKAIYRHAQRPASRLLPCSRVVSVASKAPTAACATSTRSSTGAGSCARNWNARSQSMSSHAGGPKPQVGASPRRDIGCAKAIVCGRSISSIPFRSPWRRWNSPRPTPMPSCLRGSLRASPGK